MGIHDRKLLKKCENNLEIFNLSRKVYLEQKLKFDKICVLVDSLTAKVLVRAQKSDEELTH